MQPFTCFTLAQLRPAAPSAAGDSGGTGSAALALTLADIRVGGCYEVNVLAGGRSSSYAASYVPAVVVSKWAVPPPGGAAAPAAAAGARSSSMGAVLDQLNERAALQLAAEEQGDEGAAAALRVVLEWPGCPEPRAITVSAALLEQPGALLRPVYSWNAGTGECRAQAAPLRSWKHAGLSGGCTSQRGGLL